MRFVRTPKGNSARVDSCSHLNGERYMAMTMREYWPRSNEGASPEVNSLVRFVQSAGKDPKKWKTDYWGEHRIDSCTAYRDKSRLEDSVGSMSRHLPTP